MIKILLAAFPAAALAAVFFWFHNSSNSAIGSLFADRPGMLLAFGRLAGITGALGVMSQVLIMSRAAWLEPLLGTALPVKWHHRAGLAIPLALLAHPPLVVLHHSMQTGTEFLFQYLAVLKWEDVLAAACGEALIITAVILSLPFFRRRLSYRAWYRVHLLTYAGLALSIGHQLSLGGDLNGPRPYFAAAWYFLLGFAVLNAAWFRGIKPLISSGAA